MNEQQSDTAVASSHSLSSKWCWAYKPTIVYKQQTAEDWLADYRPVLPTSVDTVELFWRVYYSVPTLSSLDFGNIYSVFKQGILPSWEDPANEQGYSVLLYLNKHVSNEFTTQLYQQALLSLIGNSEPFCEHLNGCTIERKTGGNKIAFWMASSADSSPDAQSQTAVDVIKAMRYILPQDVTYAEEDGRVEWRDAKFASFKVAVKCMSHKKRATEPVPARRDSSRSSGAPGSRGPPRPPRQQQQPARHTRPPSSSQQPRPPSVPEKNPWSGTRDHRTGQTK